MSELMMVEEMPRAGGEGRNKIAGEKKEFSHDLTLSKDADVVLRRHKRGFRLFFHKKFIEKNFPKLPEEVNFHGVAKGRIDAITRSPEIRIVLTNPVGGRL